MGLQDSSGGCGTSRRPHTPLALSTLLAGYAKGFQFGKDADVMIELRTADLVVWNTSDSVYFMTAKGRAYAEMILNVQHPEPYWCDPINRRMLERAL